MTDLTVACHQPNFIPWLGFFAKISRSDVFILLDDVQFTLGAKHNWTSRARIGTANGPMWLSLPVVRSGKGLQLISDLKTDAHPRWLVKMMKTLDVSYSHAPYAGQCLPRIIEILSRHEGSVCETNINLIRAICEMLGITTKLICSSEKTIDGTATERLINLTRSVGGNVYLSGDGADDYQLAEKFDAAGIVLRKLGFVSKPYPQRPRCDFIPGLSIVDALCFVGVEQTLDLLRGRAS